MDKTIYKVGFWSGLIAFVATVAFNIAQMLQLPGILTFPFGSNFDFGFSLCIVISLPSYASLSRHKVCITN